MGNSIARDFHQVKLVKRGTFPTEINPITDLLIPPSDNTDTNSNNTAILNKSISVLIRRDDHRKSTIVFDMENMLPLLIMKTKKRDGIKSITKDMNGKALFLTSTTKRGGIVLIYRAPSSSSSKSTMKISSATASLLDDTVHSKIYDIHDGGTTGVGDDGNVDDDISTRNQPSSTTTTTTTTMARSLSRKATSDLSTASSTTNNNNNTKIIENDLPCRAQIQIDTSGSSPTAFFSIIVWGGTGPQQLITIYKAVKVPSIKYGTLIVDMKGNAVGKTYLDEQRMEPIIKLSANTDLSCIVALVSALLGCF